jgi:hypothetical protein
MVAKSATEKRLTRLLMQLEGAMSRKTKKKTEPHKRQPEVRVAPEILSRFEQASEKKLCLLEGCGCQAKGRGLCDKHLNEFSGQRDRAREEGGFDGAKAFDDDCVRLGLILPRKFVVNPFAAARRSMATTEAQK